MYENKSLSAGLNMPHTTTKEHFVVHCLECIVLILAESFKIFMILNSMIRTHL